MKAGSLRGQALVSLGPGQVTHLPGSPGPGAKNTGRHPATPKGSSLGVKGPCGALMTPATRSVPAHQPDTSFQVPGVGALQVWQGPERCSRTHPGERNVVGISG